ncbi:hypothetical protein PHMEG_00024918 [Phytophthora megakarya]|uniref:Eukaryotic/viral aspartic protease n=1 Tax=Phytophthora megakarya TaxID=4795 RepID=A0A225VD92_9STRA|nr:hypothetical protein PHMEG_00024918 [Phytophthora megakarya]
MGIATHAYPFKVALDYWLPSEAGAELHKWKENLNTAFGSQGSGVRRQPVARAIGESVNLANIPLPQIPKKKREQRSPYFQDSHMVTSRSASRQTRVTKELDQEGLQRILVEELDVDLHDDKFKTIAYLTANIMIQMASEEMETIRRHRTDRWGKIVPFEGKLDESEISLQWLRGFVYEITLRLTNAFHGHRALSRKTKRDWKLLSSKFISYYCSQFSQTASPRYYRAKRSDKEHI